MGDADTTVVFVEPLDAEVVIVPDPEELPFVIEVGEQGPAGPSAYQLAVANGFDGTEAEWLASLAPAVAASPGFAEAVAALLRPG